MKPTRTLLRGLTVIELLAEAAEAPTRGLGPSQLAALSGLDKATVTRLLITLRSAGYAVQDPVTRSYQLTSKVMRLARGVGASEEIKFISRRHLTTLRDECDEAVHLGVMEGQSVIYIDKLESSGSIRLVSAIGQQMPVNTTSLGKAILGAVSAERRAAILERLELVARTEHSITDMNEFGRELDEVARRGFSIDDGENEDGVTCVGAAVHDVTGEVIGAISISGPSFRVQTVVDELGARCRSAAMAISRDLGQSLSGAV